jgi:hypothetical protein
MHLELSASEAQELSLTLDAALQTLLHELAHTDTRAYRETLRARHARLESVRHQLDARLSQDQAYG